tara:strand:+ start:1579 stop:1821 length:243 start_codon:yes stop_codon:yes gene_type:complete
MKKIIYIILVALFLALTNCSTSKRAKPCDTCPQFSYIYFCDTTIIVIPHHNYNRMCFPEEEIVVVEEEIIIIEDILIRKY